MPHDLTPFASIPLDEALLAAMIDEHHERELPRLERLWCYFRNALAAPRSDGGSIGAPAQRVGLPPRLRQIDPRRDDRALREQVIENDIAWRIHTLVDFMFPEPPRIVSTAENPKQRATIERALDAVFAANGGIGMWQQAALLASVFGHVDFLVHDAAPHGANATARKSDASRPADRPGDVPSKPIAGSDAAADVIGRSITIETVEASRAIALVNPDDYRRADALVVHYAQPVHAVERPGVWERLSECLFAARAISGSTRNRRAVQTVTEIHSATHMQRYESGRLVREAVNPLGRLPLVHIQNLPQPLMWAGIGDVEPLIPLQDELNTRITDRANRVTMQSFRMWLGKGIDAFLDRPIGPGQMWMTDNEDASIESFGGDADSPSETAHLSDLREATDKASGVTPAAAGHINARIGNLTSENALRISLMGTIAKIKRKRITFSAGISSLGELVLQMLNARGLLSTRAQDRGLEVVWTDPLPPDRTRALNDALLKHQLGVPTDTLRAELGYD